MANRTMEIKNSSVPDLSQITDYLYLGAWPSAMHIDQIEALGVRLVLAMHYRRPPATLWKSHIQVLWLPTIDSPLTPIPLSYLKRGVQAALPVIQEGGAVFVHCKYGVHRSAAMACCVLVGNGYTSEAAMDLIKEKRPIADPHVQYLQSRIRLFEQQFHTISVEGW